MKKLKALLAVLCIVFAACAVMACGSEDSESAKTVVNAPVINSKVYNGEKQAATVEASDAYTVIENNGGVNAGEYNVVLKLTDENAYEWKTPDKADATMLTLKFVITKATNSVSELTLNGWRAGETANVPAANAEFGEVKFAYATEQNGTYTENVPTAAGTYFVKAFEALGGEVVEVNFQTGETDFSGTMASLASQGIEAIFAPTSIETAPFIIKQAREAGINGCILASDTWDDVSIIQRVVEAGASIDGVYFSTFFIEGDDTNPAANAFAEGFKAWLKEDSARLTDNSNSEEISAVTACGYDAYMAIYYALDKAQSTDGATLRDALAALDVPGLVTGDLKFDENGDAIKSYAIIKTATTEGFVFADSVAIE